MYPYYKTGFTTVDDMRQHILAMSHHSSNIFDSFPGILEAAKSQGRLNFVWQGFSAVVPYLNSSSPYFYIIRLIGFLSSVIFSGLFAYLLTRSFGISLAIVILIFSFLQDNWNHNITTAYPFVFHATFSYFLISLIFLIKFIKVGGWSLLGFIAFYWLSLGVELFILYSPFILILTYYFVSQNLNKNNDNKFRNLVVKIYPLVLCSIIYLLGYLFWRYSYPSTYGGNQIKLDKVSDIFYTISLFTFSQTPGFDFFTSRYGVSNLIKNLFYEVKFEWIVKSILIFTSLMLIFNCKNIRNIKTRFAITCAAIFLLAALVPNILLGLTEQKRDWALRGVTSFVYSYYSFIALIFTIVFLFTGILNLFKNTSIRIFLVLSFCFLSAGISILTDFQNNKTIVDKKYSHIKWDAVSNFLNTSQFKSIPEGSILYAPSLFESRGIAVITDHYWTEYISLKSGKNIKVVKEAPLINANMPDIYYLKLFISNVRPDEYIFMSSKIDKVVAQVQNSFISHEISLFTTKKNYELLIRADYLNSLSSGKNIQANEFTRKINLDKKISNFYYYDYQSANNIYCDSIILSNYDLNNKWPNRGTLKEGVSFSEDISISLLAVEGLSVKEPWGRWSDRGLAEFVSIRFNERLPSKFFLEIRAIAFGPNLNVPTKITVGKTTKAINITGDPDKNYSLYFDNASEDDVIKIMPPNPIAPNSVNPKSKDSRKIGIGLVSLKIIPVN